MCKDRARSTIGLALVMAMGIMLTGGADGRASGQIDATAPREEASMEVTQDTTAPGTRPEELAELVAGNGRFAFDLYGLLKTQGEGNLFFSPYSISEALAMTYAGARGETASQMAQVMHYTLDPWRLHPAFQALRAYLAGLAESHREYETGDRFQLNVADSVWVERTYTLHAEFADILSRYYSVQPQLVDFRTASEEARQTINTWVSERTEGRIPELIGQGVIDSLTRLVLVNAIYFKASWEHPFRTAATRDQAFHLLDGSEVMVPMMHQTEHFEFGQGDGFGAIALPYLGNQLSMLVVMPDQGRFPEFQDALSHQRLDAIVSAMHWHEIELSFPKFRVESDFSLAQVLISLGMPLAFEPSAADFTAMADIPPADRNLYIAAVIHKAFVEVDETGTEAAAATAVIMAAEGAAMEEPPRPIPFVVDKPFFVFIRDNRSGAILFMGRVVNPIAR